MVAVNVANVASVLGSMWCNGGAQSRARAARARLVGPLAPFWLNADTTLGVVGPSTQESVINMLRKHGKGKPDSSWLG